MEDFFDCIEVPAERAHFSIVPHCSLKGKDIFLECAAVLIVGGENLHYRIDKCLDVIRETPILKLPFANSRSVPFPLECCSVLR